MIADFRAPNILRIGFAPLYLSFVDIEKAVASLTKIMNEKRYENDEFQQRQSVT